MSSSVSKRALLISVFLLALLGWVGTERNLRMYEAASPDAGTAMYVPKASLVRPFMLGHASFLADLIWIRTLGYFAGEFYGKKRYTYLLDLLNLATDLDPRFERVYIWAGAALMYNTGRISKEKILASSRFLEKGWRRIQEDPVGWRHDPRYWMIPQMIGFNYAVELHDKVRGAPYIAAAGRIPGSPDLYKTWASTLYRRAGQLEKGAEVLEDMLAIETLNAQLSDVKESEVRDRIRGRLEYFYKRLYGKGGEERLRLLEVKIRQLISQWRESFSYIDLDLFLILRPADQDLSGADL
jgi:hypothetical protein